MAKRQPASVKLPKKDVLQRRMCVCAAPDVSVAQ